MYAPLDSTVFKSKLWRILDGRYAYNPEGMFDNNSSCIGYIYNENIHTPLSIPYMDEEHQENRTYKEYTKVKGKSNHKGYFDTIQGNLVYVYEEEVVSDGKTFPVSEHSKCSMSETVTLIEFKGKYYFIDPIFFNENFKQPLEGEKDPTVFQAIFRKFMEYFLNVARQDIVIVALTGPKGSGKDTACGAYSEYKEMSFADPLRVAVESLFCLESTKYMCPTEKEKEGAMGISYRKAMQGLGTEVMRKRLSEFFPECGDDDDFWVKHMKNRLTKEISIMTQNILYNRITPHVIVITDLRFLNEAKMIKDMGGKIVRINRPNLESDDEHVSEKEGLLIEHDHLIVNDKDRRELSAKFEKYVKSLSE